MNEMDNSIIDVERLAEKVALEIEREELIKRFRVANAIRALYADGAYHSEDPKRDPNDQTGLDLLSEVDDLGAELVGVNDQLHHLEHQLPERSLDHS